MVTTLFRIQRRKSSMVKGLVGHKSTHLSLLVKIRL